MYHPLHSLQSLHCCTISDPQCILSHLCKLERKHPVLREYLERELRIRNEILDRLKNAPNAEKRAGEIEEEKQAVIAALEEYEGI